jgi:hypothetical protein
MFSHLLPARTMENLVCDDRRQGESMSGYSSLCIDMHTAKALISATCADGRWLRSATCAVHDQLSCRPIVMRRPFKRPSGWSAAGRSCLGISESIAGLRTRWRVFHDH